MPAPAHDLDDTAPATRRKDNAAPPQPPGAPEAPRSRSRLFGWARAATAALGLLALVALTVGTALDIAAVDRTRGGYEPPYDDYTGDPIDWDADTYTTPTGMVATGYVLDVYTDCRTGMISFEVLGLVTVDYRQVSERALVVHQPDEACRARGFRPDF